MAPQCLLKHHYQCCGIQVTYHEQCGHTTTKVDHHPTCKYHRSPSNPSRPASRQLTPSTPSTPQPFPQPYPKCKDLHRYIDLVPSKCPFCTNPPQIGSWNPNVSRFASTWSPLSEAEIFERDVYWLNEMLLAREETFQGALADWELGLREKREAEEVFNIPELERTFGYDYFGVKGHFLSKVESGREERKEGERRCGACKGETGNVMVRRLPCGCVLHLKCIQRRFASSKECPDCGVGFKLVKIPKREDRGGKGKGEDCYPVWEDDCSFSFI